MFDGFTQEEYERFVKNYEASGEQKKLRKEKFFNFFKKII